jgi:hypothetical protein
VCCPWLGSAAPAARTLQERGAQRKLDAIHQRRPLHEKMRTNLCLLVVVLVCPAGAWITTAQALFGTKINDIDGLFEHTAAPVAPYNTLGMLWSDSKGTNNPAGLGQAITWAWDDGLCAKLLPSFKSDPFGIPFIDCASIRSSMHRAFSTWAQNHPKITFIETSTWRDRMLPHRIERNSWLHCTLPLRRSSRRSMPHPSTPPNQHFPRLPHCPRVLTSPRSRHVQARGHAQRELPVR